MRRELRAGNTHLINGRFDASRSRVPVLAIAAQIPRDEIGSGYFQEPHPQELFRECSVYTELVSTAAQLPRVLRIAMRTAVSRRGVSVLVVPGDVLLETDRSKEQVSAVRSTVTVSRPADVELAAAAVLLNASERVTILAGAGCAGAHAELTEAARILQAPIVHTLRGKEHVEYDNPFDVGLTGLLGFASGYRAMESCDALLVLGADFPYRDFYPKDVPVVQVDVRGEQIGRRVPGSPIIWSARYLAMNGRRRLIGSFIHGSMANAMPQAIGAQAAFPGRQVIALSGDGGIAMLLGDLITLRQHRLPVKIVVFNNGALAFVELEMMSAGVPKWGTDLENPDFAEVARSLGLYGARVERPAELGPALRAAFEHDGPALVDLARDNLG